MPVIYESSTTYLTHLTIYEIIFSFLVPLKKELGGGYINRAIFIIYIGSRRAVNIERGYCLLHFP